MLLTDSNQGYIKNPVPVVVPTETILSVGTNTPPIDLLIKEEKTNPSWTVVWAIILIVGIVAYFAFKKKK